MSSQAEAAQRGRAGKFFMAFLGVLVSLYIVFTQYTAYSGIFTNTAQTIAALLCTAVFTALLYNGLKRLFQRVKDRGIAVGTTRESGFPWMAFGVCAGLTLAVLSVVFVASYPGGISPDNLTQWKQVESGQFNDWHPVFHTLLIWLATRVVNRYTFVTALQIICFSLAVGYLAACLKRWGVNRWLIGVYMLTIVGSQATRAIMMYVWKDTALTIFLLLLTTQTAHIVLSKGEWLKKSRNLAALTVTIAAATLVRHNAFFFTLPYTVILCALFFRSAKRVLCVAAGGLLLVLGVRGPLYGILGVSYTENQTYVESVGLPMTILADTVLNNPEALDLETKAFLYEIASPAEWEESYQLHNYNSIKFQFNANQVVARIPPAALFRMVSGAARSDPKTAFNAIVGLTDMVWRTDALEGSIPIVAERDAQLWEAMTGDITLDKTAAHVVYSALQGATSMPLANRLTMSIGVQMLALLLSGLFSLLHRRGWVALLLVVPSVAYNLGTMLLLCGNDYRFFHFNLVITFPLALLCLAKNAPAEKKEGIPCVTA